MIKNNEFGRAETSIVYAVIKDMPTSEKIPIYLLESDYYEVTGVEPLPNMFSIYMPVAATTSEIESLHQSLVAWGSSFATVEWNNALAENRQTLEMNNLPIIQTIALFALILSPLFWFFSQIMFYAKREEEFRMLRGLGATEPEIKKIFKQDGRIFAALGILSTVLFSVLGVYAIHKFNMTYTAFFDTGALTLYRFEMPWIPLAIAVAVTALCGYASSVIPYRIDKKKARKTIAKEFGE
jgi:ABC-type lipoprotein release transport system permease subunit